jgi:hypothetical protein
MPSFGIAISARRPSISSLRRSGNLFPQWNFHLYRYLRRPTTVRAIRSAKDYTRIVKRQYTMARIKGGMKFTCTHCPHQVSTLDFDLRDGNLRTQAATAINRHATAVHHEPVMFSSLDAQQRIWRT